MIALIASAVLFQAMNALTPSEIKKGWTLLFDGKTTKGWHTFKQALAGPGWVVKNGVLTSVDPNTAGDLVSDAQFDWFELALDYKMGKDQNSGIMFRVADDGPATWYSGPEVQIYDDHGEPGAQKSGWLYELYSSPVDSTKPPGQWNHFRIIVSPKMCATYVNGVKYYEYVLGSDDFKARVAKSKFADMPQFAKLATGSIGIQGDHGVVSFRNIKIRRIGG